MRDRTCRDETMFDLSTEKDCREAATSVGMNFSRSNVWIQFPSGCFINMALHPKQVFLNKNPNGIPHRNAKSICRDRKYIISVLMSD